MCSHKHTISLFNGSLSPGQSLPICSHTWTSHQAANMAFTQGSAWHAPPCSVARCPSATLRTLPPPRRLRHAALSLTSFTLATSAICCCGGLTTVRPRNFSTSSMSTTGAANASTSSHSLKLSGTMLNTEARNGT
jgi:hypothetical protein